ncbi:phage tail tape measure protein [Rhodoplanes sp. SY1]|uniref:phage tail tape measure protein n=1 Tax=Rhodoplanes sp. SY1 TaxID=3166646 RepID=UPI0038B58603
MGSAEGVLRIRLVDGVSGPARTAAGALKGLDRQARSMNGVRNLGRYNMLRPGAEAPGGSGLLAAGGTRALLGLGAGYMAARTAGKGYKDFADLDRSWTRLGITAEATAKQLADARTMLHGLAAEFGVGQKDAFSGLEALVTQGFSLPDALAQMRSILIAAQASGAEVSDISKTSGALSMNLKVAAGEMEKAFDMLAFAGKKGQFELKDMAQYMPQLAAGWSNVGQKGVNSLADLAAGLQIIRKQTGTSENAFNGMRDLLAKIYSKDVQKNLKEAGVDLEEGLKKGRREGRSVLDVITELTEKVTKGDLSQLPKFFGEIDSRNAISALINLKREFQTLRAEIRNTSAGTTMQDVKRVTNDAAAGVQRLGDSWSNFTAAAGSLGWSAGVGSVLDELTKSFNGLGATVDMVGAKLKSLRGEAPDALGESKDAPKTVDELKRRLTRTKYADELRQAKAQLLIAERDLDVARATHAKRPGLGRDPGDASRRVDALRERIAVLEGEVEARKPPPAAALPVKKAKTFRDIYPTLLGPRQDVAPATPIAPGSATTPARALPAGVRPATPIAPRAETGAIEAVTAKAGEAKRAVQELGAARAAPQVDVAPLRSALATAEQLAATLSRINGMKVSPAISIPGGIGAGAGVRRGTAEQGIP